MSLRARVLAGFLVIAVLLVGAALTITRITENHLIERVDRQLDPRADDVERCGIGILDVLGQPPPAEPGTEPVPGEEPTVYRGSTTTGDCEATNARVGPGVVDLGATDGTTETTTATEPGADPDAEAAGPAKGCPPEGEEGGIQGNFRTETNRPPTDDGPLTGPLIAFSVGCITDEGTLQNLAVPGGVDGISSPDIDMDEVRDAADSGEAYTTGSTGGDSRWRIRAVIDEQADQLFVVAMPLDDVDAIVGRLVLIEVVVTLAILAALALVAWWVDRHGIRPVKRMTATATAIAAGDLSHRVAESGDSTEAGRLGTALNTMLGRIEEAFDERARSEAKLRQFVADASHELRTPVTTIRGYSELFESGGLDDQADLSEAMRRTRQEAMRMGSLVDDLLLLARLDQGPALTRDRVDLAALVDDAGRDAQAVDPERTVVTAGEGPLEVLGDGDRLRQVLANLVGNALVHTPSSAALDLRTRREGDRAVVEIRDDGPGMPPEVAERAFERFFRADPSRSRHRGGSGLGLAIVQATVAVHGGEVRLESRPGAGTTARVTLPLAT